MMMKKNLKLTALISLMAVAQTARPDFASWSTATMASAEQKLGAAKQSFEHAAKDLKAEFGTVQSNTESAINQAKSAVEYTVTKIKSAAVAQKWANKIKAAQTKLQAQIQLVKIQYNKAYTQCTTQGNKSHACQIVAKLNELKATANAKMQSLKQHWGNLKLHYPGIN